MASSITRSSQRLVRQFSANARPAPTPRAVPRQEYPTSFISHLKTQKMNVFNIGIAFVTLSLSSQLVSYKQKNEKLDAQNAHLTERVHMLEELVVSLGGTVPIDETDADQLAAVEAAAQADAERVKKAREAEARALVAAAEDAQQPQKKKSVLI